MTFYMSLALGLSAGLAAHLWANCSLLRRVLQPTAAAAQDAWGPDSPGSGWQWQGVGYKNQFCLGTKGINQGDIFSL